MAQFAYQFSHEFCHIMSDYERLRENPNGWFHEAICELASVFTLRCMAERWSSCAPYPNWVEYSDSLLSYAEDCLSCEDRLVARRHDTLCLAVVRGRDLAEGQVPQRQERDDRILSPANLRGRPKRLELRS